MRYIPPSANIIILGPSGSGKTVLLGTMYHKLSSQGEWGFFLKVNDFERRKLNQIYTTVATDKKWPPANMPNEVSEWVFTCCIDINGQRYNTCKFVYFDYAGINLTNAELPENSDFDIKIGEANILLALLDGSKICAWLREEVEGVVWVVNQLKNLLDIITDKASPDKDKIVHFVVSKWDVVESSGYSLEQVREKLLEDDTFSNVINARKKANRKTRLIPISSVGQGFATPLEDGSMRKNLGKMPKPFQIEVPLACVLPDLIESKRKELDQSRWAEISSSTTVTATLGFWEEKSQKWPGWLINFPGIKKVAVAAEEKKRDAANRSAELRQRRDAVLARISDEESALKSVLYSFISIQEESIQYEL